MNCFTVYKNNHNRILTSSSWKPQEYFRAAEDDSCEAGEAEYIQLYSTEKMEKSCELSTDYGQMQWAKVSLLFFSSRTCISSSIKRHFQAYPVGAEERESQTSQQFYQYQTACCISLLLPIHHHFTHKEHILITTFSNHNIKRTMKSHLGKVFQDTWRQRYQTVHVHETICANKYTLYRKETEPCTDRDC